MRIDKRLNIVIPLPRDEEGTVYVHATPVSREVFETYFIPMSVAFSRIWDEGLAIRTGPRVAYMMLKKVSEERRIWDGPDGVAAGLAEEMKRLTNVFLPTPNGWNTVAMYSAIEQRLLSPDEIRTVENAVCFFTLASAIFPSREVASILAAMNDLWGTQSVLLSSMEFVASLRTSTVPVSTSANLTVVASSVPS